MIFLDLTALNLIKILIFKNIKNKNKYNNYKLLKMKLNYLLALQFDLFLFN